MANQLQQQFIQQLNNQVVTLVTEQTRHQTAINNLNISMNNVLHRLNTLEGRVQGLSGSFQGVQGHLQALDARITSVDQNMQTLGQGLTGRMAGMEQMIGGLNERMNGLEMRIDGIDVRMQSANQEIAQRFNRIDQALINLSDQISNLVSQLAPPVYQGRNGSSGQQGSSDQQETEHARADGDDSFKDLVLESIGVDELEESETVAAEIIETEHVEFKQSSEGMEEEIAKLKMEEQKADAKNGYVKQMEQQRPEKEAEKDRSSDVDGVEEWEDSEMGAAETIETKQSKVANDAAD